MEISENKQDTCENICENIYDEQYNHKFIIYLGAFSLLFGLLGIAIQV